MFEEFWWIIPIVMMALCFYVMRGKKGLMMCGHGSNVGGNHVIRDSDSALEIVGKRYALGEIDKTEYEDKKKAFSHSENQEGKKD